MTFDQSLLFVSQEMLQSALKSGIITVPSPKVAVRLRGVNRCKAPRTLLDPQSLGATSFNSGPRTGVGVARRGGPAITRLPVAFFSGTKIPHLWITSAAAEVMFALAVLVLRFCMRLLATGSYHSCTAATTWTSTLVGKGNPGWPSTRLPQWPHGGTAL